MPRPIRRIDIYLPLDDNEGLPIEEAKFVALQSELVNRFGGVTSTRREFPLLGLWQSETDLFQDRVVVLTVIDFRGGTELETLRYLRRLKARLKKKFAQLDILITVQKLLAI